MLEPTIPHPNGDLEYVARNGKLLLQVDTGIVFRRAYEKAGGKHHQYEEIDELETTYSQETVDML